MCLYLIIYISIYIHRYSYIRIYQKDRVFQDHHQSASLHLKTRCHTNKVVSEQTLQVTPASRSFTR